MHTIPRDFILAVNATHGDTYEWSRVLLARAHLDGRLELLTAAWGRVLGYGHGEFSGKTLGEFMTAGKSAAPGIVAAILDPDNMDPVEVTLSCRRGEAKPFRLHRRYDPYTPQMFIVAEEVPGERVRVGAVRTR
jgi:hypothetical protein